MLLLCSGLFIGFRGRRNYPYGGIRSAVTISVVLVSAAIVVKVRSVTLRFVRTNRELSEVDALTGVANLRALRLRVEYVLERADRRSTAMRPMLMTVDLDRFKQVNDRYNHTTGDQVLEAVARAISEMRADRRDGRAPRRRRVLHPLRRTHTPSTSSSVIPRVRKAVAHARERICPDLTADRERRLRRLGARHERRAVPAQSADGIMHDEKIETRARDYEQVA